MAALIEDEDEEACKEHAALMAMCKEANMLCPCPGVANMEAGLYVDPLGIVSYFTAEQVLGFDFDEYKERVAREEKQVVEEEKQVVEAGGDIGDDYDDGKALLAHGDLPSALRHWLDLAGWLGVEDPRH